MQSILLEIIETGVYFYNHIPSNVDQSHKTTSRVAYVNDIRQPTKRSPFLKRDDSEGQPQLKCKECDTNLYTATLLEGFPSARIRPFSFLDKRSQEKYSLSTSKFYIGTRASSTDKEINQLLKYN